MLMIFMILGDLIDHALVEYVWVLHEAKYLRLWYEPTRIDFRQVSPIGNFWEMSYVLFIDAWV